ncbi:MAG: hypothetical protein A2487_19240 [Candidatus Raymondbacteria bacterium RifOxyC12_full_50_8]|uniref:EfeO-type cupredoxin-like domain-containing protein n=1 Tax=Candidatus Raymondbacteria bacterium RIFOXYD12_FULL_49_13 TaxID=1817890 RepID=A0A1F7FF73_UNCRA|nr:MAG: hypothetical protein A2248_22535 [Candidatus Raymondbacteria bacterium RIFOXYA2_FULL_49_16]OGK01032.1 MAG: hypothetical protein A2350_11700 [Candidatus Raymondbacteria bacterium RifOxyB12_full_50_8]OGK03382.1 MAG: hypothetical protein A2487_19240 [Candidatus Raymondbacteria bacterium RifOxyC12_full_50_8]OGK05350.1 MAG: hypothetical protein A2519_03485 [Candidatus Raymondbacteria bacterium RIFOXYD12_FULL_49_13]OGP42963.1 MAG: hypothetical protein A2324_16190 [Candidatus Raymondbacteria b
MKKILILAAGVFALFLRCASCKDEPPRVMLINNGTDRADIQIKTSGGNTENVNGIEVGQSSLWRTFDPGDIKFTIAIHGEDSTFAYTLHAETCMEYKVTVTPANQVTASGEEVD